MGGGTPSLLTVDELVLIIETVYKNYTVIAYPEITLEANPDDLANRRVNDLAHAQINRLSIGIQSFFEEDLKSMNRAHNAEEAKACLLAATRHFDNISIDLIYGIPNMSLKKWDENLNIAFGFDINHISSYALTVEPKTALDTFIKKGTYPPVDDEVALQHFKHLVSKTALQGFVHYEVSNFGKSGYFSKHNTSYWHGKPYMGIGPSAHSFNNTQRSWNVANNTSYIKAIQTNVLPNTIEILSKNDMYNEYIMTGLRTIWGVSLKNIEGAFGKAYKKHALQQAEPYIRQRLLFVEQDTLKATSQGKFLVDGMASDLFI